MKKGLLLFTLVLLSFTGIAQTLVMEERGFVKPRLAYEGLDNYKHFYSSIGALSADDNVSFKVGGSYNFNLGFRYINGLGKRYGMGFALEFNKLNYRVDRNDFNGAFKFSNEDILSENLVLNTLDAEWIHRFRIGDSGKKLGYFFDLGFYFNRMLSNKAVADYTPFKYEGSGEIVHKDVNYVWHMHRGMTARLGFNKYVIYVKRRGSRGLKSNAPYEVELPKLVFGFQIGFH